jgi:Zn-dependent protease with chaperone function
MEIIQQLVWVRVIYILVAALALWFFQTVMFKRRMDYPERRWRSVFIFRTLHGGLIIGYLILVLKHPLWVRLFQTIPIPEALIAEDLLNLLLMMGFVTFFLWLSYWNDRFFRGLNGRFGSYLIQYSYFWLFLLNILIFLRIDYFYLPLLPNNLSFTEQFVIQVTLLAVMLFLQLAVLGIRRLKMSTASPELTRLVHEVAGRFKIHIRSVRVWHLERVANAFATGIFLRSIFLTDSILENTSPQDLRMIIGHECAHFKRHHLEIRVLILAVLIYLASMLIENYPGLHWTAYLGIGILGYICFKAIARAQEFDADRQAAKFLGGPTPMILALNRVFACNGSPQRLGIIRWLMGHPDLASRIGRLEALIEETN